MVGRSSTPHLLIIVRHGKAEDSHPEGDDARALTEEGRDDFRAHARKLAPHLALQGLMTSPLVRAVQTAEILAEACGVNRVVVKAELAYVQASARTIEALGRSSGPGWALVGHNPSLAEGLAHLLGLGSAVPRLRKGAVVALERSPTGALPWSLAWIAEPGRKRRTVLD